MTTDERDRVQALLPEDRDWLAEQGWVDPSGIYPTIGTVSVTE